MGASTFVRALAISLTATAGGLGAARAQQAWDWPEKPKNLQVLPKDWPGSRLWPVMTGFTNALGVRCEHCHVGEPGQPLSSFDFASDANPNKNRARAMLKMLGDIGADLKTIEPSGDKRVNTWCHTCHRGRPRPMTLGEELGEVFRKAGWRAALEQYQTLKERFYGRGAYDFGENGLNQLGCEILRAGDAAGAVETFRRNADLFPESANAWDSLGEGYLTAGDLDRAQAACARSVELDPSNANAKSKLEEIRKKR